MSYRFLVLAKCGMNDAHVEKNLGRVRDLFKLAEGLVKLVVVIV